MLNTISYLFTINEGLSSTKITCITQDTKGLFWMGTEDGLNRFDGYNFTTFKKQYGDSLSLISNRITALCADSRGRMWVGTMEGLVYYDQAYDNFVNVSLNQPDNLVKQGQCEAIMEDRKGNLWFAVSGRGVVRYSPETGKSVLFTPLPQNPSASLCSAHIHTIEEDKNGQIWFGSQDKGISVYNPLTGAFRNMDTTNSGLPDDVVFDILSLKNGHILVATLKAGVALYDTQENTFRTYPNLFDSPNVRTVLCAAEDTEGNIFIGTEGQGVFVFDPEKGELQKQTIMREFSRELDDAKVSCLHVGLHNYVWIGLMYKGVFVVGNEKSAFRVIKKIRNNPNSLNYDYVTAVTTDRDRDIWIATDGGGLNRYHATMRQITHYTYWKDDARSLPDNAVTSVFCDSRNRIWTSAKVGGLCLFDRETETFTRYENANTRHLSIQSIREDQQGFLWLGTNAGLMRFDPENKQFQTYRSADHKGLTNDHITILWIDSRNKIWIGTYFGVSCMDIATETFTAFGKESKLNNRSIYSIGESPDGTIWVGTANGLNRYDSIAGRFSPVVLGSPTEMLAVNGIVANEEHLWLSTNQGLIRYNVASGDAKRYSRSNSGVGSDEFLQGSYHKSHTGEIFFGGTNGLDVFDPSEIHDSITVPRVYLTQLSISNEPVLINKEINGRIVLQRNIMESKKIKLRYSDKNFTLHFVALGIFKTYSTVFARKLEGFDKDWVIHDYNHRNVTYTNLNPGTYTFHIKASSDPKVWGNEDTMLIIEIEPPLWYTWWAKLIYILIGLGIIYGIFRISIIRVQEKNELKIERVRVKQQEELNVIRNNFFTNISHEFRTPLTLIIGPMKRIVSEDDNEERKKAGFMILRNAERLQRLIDQILDLNKIEEGKMTLHVQPLELVAFVTDFIHMFNELMSLRSISLTHHYSHKRIEVWYDPDMLEKCLSNILYNAYKFTPDGGKVHLDIKATEEEGKILLSVCDTGIGMNQEMQEHLFDRFFQGHKEYNMTGTGIGMHLTKTIVELHKGTITVESEEGKGSCFYITLRTGNSHFMPEDLSVKAYNYLSRQMLTPAPTPLPSPQPQIPGAPTLLLIEDNGDMRLYIRHELSGLYNIEEAADGKTGLHKALHLLPDLIIADVMMPEMNGIELCRILKSTPDTSHIPVIMLTALDGMKHRLEGMESGADSFITKPFNTKYLQIRIEKLIELRRKMKERFSKSIYMDVQELSPLTSMDERLLQKAIAYIRSNIENSNLSVEHMSKELGISRTHLHRKLKALTGQSPVEFIKTIRMKQAANLLNTGKLSISEVGYKVGFNTPSYFSSCFNAHFGMSPTAYMEKIAAQHKPTLPEKGS
ncbi:MAG: response regulator [Tannerellaceae bacterium]|jgi:signal transduction histidine kinase/ligand-binding sensor domain-containing protein/DNA-binding response OmpR family regulator|nr:response regulator [Tannerellaceae bacterium]